MSDSFKVTPKVRGKAPAWIEVERPVTGASFLIGPDEVGAKYISRKRPGTSAPSLPITHIQEAIRRSRTILELEDNWDEEGAVAVAPATFERATDFLIDSAIRLWKFYSLCLNAPDISLVPDGSIDLHWRIEDRELLINVPADPAEPLSYYGDNSIGQIVKGKLPSSTKDLWLLMWLMQ